MQSGYNPQMQQDPSQGGLQGPNFGLLQLQGAQPTQTQQVAAPLQQGGSNPLGGLLGGLDKGIQGRQGVDASQGAKPAGGGLLSHIFGTNSVQQANQAISQQMAQMPPEMLGKHLLGLGGNPAPGGVQGGIKQLQDQQKQQQMLRQQNFPQGQKSPPVNPMALSAIKEFEGFTSKPSWDVNAYRAGYGSDTMTTADGKVMKIEPGMHVSQEDAERDLQRRTAEFEVHASSQVGRATWASLPEGTQAALTSLAYNHGSLPPNVVSAVKTGDPERIAQSVLDLSGWNHGTLADRRAKEAAMIRGETPQ